MATILVEARKSPAAGAFLDRAAQVLRDGGHRVVRWRGPRSGRVPYSRLLWPCDLAILFNGTHTGYRPYHCYLDRWQTPRLYVELGWYPQQDHFQVDPQGINAAASWAGQRLESPCRTPLPVRGSGDLLVVLQHDQDTQITEMSPWFENMLAFVRHLVEHSALPLRLRKHPRHALDAQIGELADAKGIVWDQSPSLAAALDTCKAVACVNSSSAVEALARGLPVLCFGKAVYRHPGAVICLTDDADQLDAATRELREGRCGLFVEPIEELVRRITTRQWTLDDVRRRLPPLVESLLERRAGLLPWWSRFVPPFAFGRPAA
jgi:hypothetical protein